MARRIFITDKEVARAAEISVSTLSRIVHGFHRGKKVDGERVIDLADAMPEYVGGYRRWRISNVARILGVTPEELEDRIS